MDTSSCPVHLWGKRLGGSKDASFAAKAPEVREVTMVSQLMPMYHMHTSMPQERSNPSEGSKMRNQHLPCLPMKSLLRESSRIRV
ncbi:hypothetical protein SCLCIDRAFT_1207201 [Scleroderma citrinum Foug A]|uniref:Uncharacterized protein n=1 Tax=Scleroderma citrinum Foug A TaxID=1036808 RepID=A0A0C3EQ08_9AGAM|nr:hypothetical protein SCLCIDRAFT_1207201 [Scleroderma citrinum Foug A]